MGVVLYKGSRGQGKTLTMVKDALKYNSQHWDVFTNLSDTPFMQITSEEILSISGTSKLKNCVLVIDEIELFFDSRDWKKEESKNFGKFLQQIRKRRVVILCTAQFTNLIEIRLRQQIDTLVLCSYEKLTQIVTCTYIDVTSVESNPLSPDFYIINYFGPAIFNYYNTYQIIE